MTSNWLAPMWFSNFDTVGATSRSREVYGENFFFSRRAEQMLKDRTTFSYEWLTYI